MTTADTAHAMQTQPDTIAENLPFSEIQPQEEGREIIAALFCGRHIIGQIAAITTKNEHGNDYTVKRYTCTQSGDPSESRWTPIIDTKRDTIAEGIANLEHHERDPGEQMPPIINVDIMTTDTWYSKNTGSDQTLIISEATGANIAVTYDPKHGPLIAAAPDLLAALRIIHANAAESVEWIRRHTAEAIAKATGEEVPA